MIAVGAAITPSFGGCQEIDRIGRDAASFVSLSLDGRRLAFSLACNGREGIWMCTNEKGSARLLVSSPQGDILPTWCPSGDYLVFSRRSAAGRSLWYVKPGETEPHKITSDRRKVFEDPLSFSPDGGQLLFARITAPLIGQGATASYFIRNMDSQIVSQVPAVSGGVFTPDSKCIIYADKEWRLQSLDIANGITTDIGGMGQPIGISPDGSHLILTIPWASGANTNRLLILRRLTDGTETRIGECRTAAIAGSSEATTVVFLRDPGPELQYFRISSGESGNVHFRVARSASLEVQPWHSGFLLASHDRLSPDGEEVQVVFISCRDLTVTEVAQFGCNGGVHHLDRLLEVSRESETSNAD